ncbi:hypothetical protein QTP88_018215 [Uroleucon formosanum]
MSLRYCYCSACVILPANAYLVTAAARICVCSGCVRSVAEEEDRRELALYRCISRRAHRLLSVPLLHGCCCAVHGIGVYKHGHVYDNIT